jgi:hypothetical protein
LPVEVDHQVGRRLVIDFPERRNNALCSRFNKSILDIGDSLFADRANARVAGGESYEIGVEVELPDLAYLKQSVVDGRCFGRKHQGGAIREFRIGISMKRQMYDFVLSEREAFEICLGCLGAQKNGFGGGKSVAMLSTSLRLSGRATSWRRSGPEIARRMLAINVIGGGLEIHAATPR